MRELFLENDGLIGKFVTRFLGTLHRRRARNVREDIYQAARVGLLKAFQKFDPDKGRFATIAWYEMRHEMQKALVDTLPMTIPRGQHRPRAGLVERFYATNGRDPLPEEIGFSPAHAALLVKAQARFVSVGQNSPRPRAMQRWAPGIEEEVAEAEAVRKDTPEPEAALDRARDMRALQAYLGTLNDKDQRAFWRGREDLVADATAAVERARAVSR